MKALEAFPSPKWSFKAFGCSRHRGLGPEPARVGRARRRPGAKLGGGGRGLGPGPGHGAAADAAAADAEAQPKPDRGQGGPGGKREGKFEVEGARG